MGEPCPAAHPAANLLSTRGAQVLLEMHVTELLELNPPIERLYKEFKISLGSFLNLCWLYILTCDGCMYVMMMTEQEGHTLCSTRLLYLRSAVS